MGTSSACARIGSFLALYVVWLVRITSILGVQTNNKFFRCFQAAIKLQSYYILTAYAIFVLAYHSIIRTASLIISIFL